MIFIVLVMFLGANVYLYYKFPKQLQQKHKQYDACIILGSPTNTDGSCSQVQRNRMDRAIELYQARKVNTLIVSGGCVKNAFCEAMVMQDYAQKRGIPIQDIVLEEKARNTYENLLYSKQVCESLCFHHVIVVTSKFHVRRASFFVRKFFTEYAMAGTHEKVKWKHYLSEYIRMWNTLRIECVYYFKKP